MKKKLALPYVGLIAGLAWGVGYVIGHENGSAEGRVVAKEEIVYQLGMGRTTQYWSDPEDFKKAKENANLGVSIAKTFEFMDSKGLLDEVPFGSRHFALPGKYQYGCGPHYQEIIVEDDPEIDAEATR